MNRTPIAPGEFYHCYSRGVDKRVVFTSAADYSRFLQLLFLCNDSEAVRRDNIRGQSSAEILARKRAGQCTQIYAYCLMPNHFHLLVREVIEGGISKFMQKLGTAYTMYFNIKHERSGNLFVKPFRSKHVDDDRYLRQLIDYIHLNPAELSEPGWKSGIVKDSSGLRDSLLVYRYSSLRDYTGHNRPERAILCDAAFTDFEIRPFEEMMSDALKYYREREL